MRIPDIRPVLYNTFEHDLEPECLGEEHGLDGFAVAVGQNELQEESSVYKK